MISQSLSNRHISPELNDVRELSLKLHNSLRKKHGAPDLVLNDRLNQIAQNYAKLIAQTHNFKHNDDIKSLNIGENLYYTCDSKKKNFTGMNYQKSLFKNMLL